MIDITISDDYAVLTTTNYGFYYGYEYDTKENTEIHERLEYGETEDVWGFEVNGNDGKLFSITADEMEKMENCPDEGDCEKMLLFGIGIFMNKYVSDLEEYKSMYESLCK